MTSPATPTIDSDLLCHTCGYNLRTLPLAANCPECNIPISDSLRAHEKSKTFPHRRLAEAARLLLFGELIHLLGWLHVVLHPHPLPPAVFRVSYATLTFLKLLSLGIFISAVFVARPAIPGLLRRSVSAVLFFISLTLHCFSRIASSVAGFAVAFELVDQYPSLRPSRFVNFVLPFSDITIHLFLWLAILFVASWPAYRRLRSAAVIVAPAIFSLLTYSMITSLLIDAGRRPSDFFPQFISRFYPHLRLALSVTLILYWLTLYRIARRHAHAAPITL